MDQVLSLSHDQKVMSENAQILLMFGGLSLIQMVCFGGLVIMAFRSEPATRDGGEEGTDEGGSGGQPRPAGGPTGGPPMRDARPSSVRLRGPQRLADLLPSPIRRRTVEPRRPARRMVLDQGTDGDSFRWPAPNTERTVRSMSTSPLLHVSIGEREEAGLVSAAGELDLASRDELAAAVAGAFDAHDRVELDLSEVTFVDSSGLHALQELSSAASERDVELWVRDSPALGRLLRVLG